MKHLKNQKSFFWPWTKWLPRLLKTHLGVFETGEIIKAHAPPPYFWTVSMIWITEMSFLKGSGEPSYFTRSPRTGCFPSWACLIRKFTIITICSIGREKELLTSKTAFRYLKTFLPRRLWTTLNHKVTAWSSFSSALIRDIHLLLWRFHLQATQSLWVLPSSDTMPPKTQKELVRDYE